MGPPITQCTTFLVMVWSMEDSNLISSGVQLKLPREFWVLRAKFLRSFIQSDSETEGVQYFAQCTETFMKHLIKIFRLHIEHWYKNMNHIGLTFDVVSIGGYISISSVFCVLNKFYKLFRKMFEFSVLSYQKPLKKLSICVHILVWPLYEGTS